MPRNASVEFDLVCDEIDDKLDDLLESLDYCSHNSKWLDYLLYIVSVGLLASLIALIVWSII